jgi:hypothetical protein
MSLLAVNGFQLSTPQMSDDWFEDSPTQSELSNWLNQLAVKFGKTFPNVNKDSAKPTELARILSQMIYGDAYADTILSEADINYQLSFDDAAEVPKERRADVAILLRDGYFAVYPDLTLKPNKGFSRAKTLRLIEQIYAKQKMDARAAKRHGGRERKRQSRIKQGKTKKSLAVRPDVFLLRQFGSRFIRSKKPH